MYPFNQQNPQELARQKLMQQMMAPQTGMPQQMPQMPPIAAAMQGGGRPPMPGGMGPGGPRAGGPGMMRPGGQRGPQMNPITGMPMNPRNGAPPMGGMPRPNPGIGRAMGAINGAMQQGQRPQGNAPGLAQALASLQNKRGMMNNYG